MKEKENYNDRPVYGQVLFISIVTILVLCLWVGYMATDEKASSYKYTGVIGDTIGGLSAPLIGLLGALLVYVAFVEQVKANKMQWYQHKASKWYDQKNNKLEKIQDTIIELKLIIPTGNKEEEEYYDARLEYSGELAKYIIRQKLKNYSKLNPQQRLAVDYYVFEYGFILIEFEIFANLILKEAEVYPHEVKLLKNQIGHLYYRYLKGGLVQLLERLNETNDPKKIKEKLQGFLERLDSLVEPHFNQNA